MKTRHSGMIQWAVPAAVAAGVMLVAAAGLYLAGKNGTTPVAVEPKPAISSVADRRADDRPTERVAVADVKPQLQPATTVVVAQSTIPAADRSQEPKTSTQLLAAQLAAGEFGPAIELAKTIEKIEVRDHVLAQIALAQAQIGEYDSSLRTAGYIRDDVARTGALQQIGSTPVGAAGGTQLVDFQSLMDLITNTAKPRDSWEDQGGPGTIRPFPQGVYVDASGMLQRKLVRDGDQGLVDLRDQAAIDHGATGRDPRQSSGLRKVSLTRLEKFVQLKAARGEPITEDMRTLAGLQRIEYVFVYPESGDLVIAGPAGDWRLDGEGRTISTDKGTPVVLLEDYVVVARYTAAHPGEPFGCLIDPRQENMVKVQEFIQKSAQRPLKPNERKAWLEELRSTVGQQDIKFIGPFDPRTHAARVLVEADYRMKLVGIGLEEGTVNVESYMDMLSLKPNDPPPPMGLLRWWFTLNYQAVSATEKLNAFHINGQAVQVKSEDMLLAENGEKTGSGKSSELSQRFAHSFTNDFTALSQKYPVYGELRNIFDISLACALIHTGGLADQVDWQQTYFLDEAGGFPLELGAAPAAVDSVMNHKVFHGKTIVAQVSGGVSVNPWTLVKKSSLEIDRIGRLGSRRDGSVPYKVPENAWWWD